MVRPKIYLTSKYHPPQKKEKYMPNLTLAETFAVTVKPNVRFSFFLMSFRWLRPPLYCRITSKSLCHRAKLFQSKLFHTRGTCSAPGRVNEKRLLPSDLQTSLKVDSTGKSAIERAKKQAHSQPREMGNRFGLRSGVQHLSIFCMVSLQVDKL